MNLKTKETTRLHVNTVGAGTVSAHVIENSQRGITLVALVITIIVLLILAGITLNMALRR